MPSKCHNRPARLAFNERHRQRHIGRGRKCPPARHIWKAGDQGECLTFAHPTCLMLSVLQLPSPAVQGHVVLGVLKVPMVMAGPKRVPMVMVGPRRRAPDGSESCPTLPSDV